jgi:hypothetical protein
LPSDVLSHGKKLNNTEKILAELTPFLQLYLMISVPKNGDAS